MDAMTSPAGDGRAIRFIALAVVTLGFGLTYWGYRNWAFVVRHSHLYGTVNLSDMSQSTVRSPGEAEGFADMFDVGAI